MQHIVTGTVGEVWTLYALGIGTGALLVVAAQVIFRDIKASWLAGREG